MFPAVFLDRDGVLIENRADYVRDWSQVTILPKTIAALANFRHTGYKIILVTNQSGIGRGLISLKTAQEINDQLVRAIEGNGGRIDGVYMCPHTPEDQCDCRKPRSGLLLQAARVLSLDLRSSWMVGDAWSDLLAGQAANLRGVILLKTGRGTDQLLEPKPENLKDFLVFNDLSDALDSIKNSSKT